MRRFLLICMLGATLAAACSGGSDDPVAPIPTATPSTAYSIPPEISAEQLQSVTLGLADFGQRYATFETAVDSELTATIERSLSACDPDKEQASLSRYGWTKGYSRYFSLPEGGALDSVAVGTVIDIYSTPDNAATKIKYDSKQIHEDQRAPGGCGGAGIERIEELALPVLGDQTWSVRASFSIGGVRGSRHVMMFRRDRIVATVTITRLNSEDSSAELLELAKKVDERLLTIITAPLSLGEPPATDNEVSERTARR